MNLSLLAAIPVFCLTSESTMAQYPYISGEVKSDSDARRVASEKCSEDASGNGYTNIEKFINKSLAE